MVVNHDSCKLSRLSDVIKPFKASGTYFVPPFSYKFSKTSTSEHF